MSAVPNYVEETIEAGKIYDYCFPESKKNPNGNPHQVALPETVAQRIPGESVPEYRIRIANEVTFAMYPNLRARHG